MNVPDYDQKNQEFWLLQAINHLRALRGRFIEERLEYLQFEEILALSRWCNCEIEQMPEILRDKISECIAQPNKTVELK